VAGVTSIFDFGIPKRDPKSDRFPPDLTPQPGELQIKPGTQGRRIRPPASHITQVFSLPAIFPVKEKPCLFQAPKHQ
jgi:hypothetical protein